MITCQIKVNNRIKVNRIKVNVGGCCLFLYAVFGMEMPTPKLNKHCNLLFLQCRCIVHSMSNTRCQAFNWLLIPLFAIVVGVRTMHLGIIELYLLFALTIFVVAAHIHYGICVVINVLFRFASFWCVFC